jgi:HlyD family secretion protein
MAAKQKRSWVKWVVGLAIVAGGAFAYYWYAEHSKAGQADFKTVVVGRGDIQQSVTANGQISPVKSVVVGSQISGQILDIKVDFNSKVKENDILAQIDPSTYQRAVAQADAQLLSAKASRELTEVNYRRATNLLQSRLIAVADADKAVADLHQAEANVKMDEANLESRKVDLERTTIKAPIDGVIISRNVDVGQTVAASFNTPSLFLIANDLKQMQIEAAVSEADVGGVLEGQPVTFLVDAYPSRQFEGRVNQVRFAPITNQNVVTYTSVIGVKNDDLKLRPGMTANVSIITSQRTNVIRIPNAALRVRPPENAVLNSGTNRVAGAGGSTNTTNTAGAMAAGGMPTPPWGAGPPPSREEMQKWMQSLTPEQRDQMRQMRERMRAQSGDGPPGGGFRGGGAGGGGFGMFGGGTGRTPASDAPETRTIYLLVRTNAPGGREIQLAKPVTVKAGSTDGAFTEVLEGLKEGDLVITGQNTPLTAGSAQVPQGTSPFTQRNPFGGGPPRR